MHIADVDKGMLGANGIVGGGGPLACGSGLTAKVLGTDQVTVCFYGDGAAEQGTMHESMNLASIWKLPVIFVCENNLYAESTPWTYHGATKNFADRAAAYNMPGVLVDGTDVFAVYEAAGEAVARMGLRHVVITAVARDDLPDGGAAQSAATIAAVRRRCPGVTIEVLIPDFGGSVAALQRVIAARPDVLNHNIETVPRLYPTIQPRKDYRRALGVLAWARRAGLTTKAGLILGMGETRGEVIQVMKDLRRVGCELLTLGQYLQPTSRNWPVAEYIHPVEFAWYREVGLTLGFQAVAAGPLVRSSYQAGDLLAQRLLAHSEAITAG